MMGLVAVYNITASFEEIVQNVILYLPKRKTFYLLTSSKVLKDKFCYRMKQPQRCATL